MMGMVSRLYRAVVLGSRFLGCLVDLCAQLLDIAQALGMDVLSLLRESGTMKEAKKGLSSSEGQRIDC